MSKIFTSSKGIVIALRPVSQHKLNSMRNAKVEVPVPTYRVQTVGGDGQEFLLDETSAKNKNRLDEWNEYLAAKKIEDTKYSEKFANFLIWEGVNVVVPGPESNWQKTNDYFGIKTPDDPIARKTLYVYNELLGVAEEVGDLIAEILAVSAVIDEEAAKKLRRTFRPDTQRETDRELPEVEGAVEHKKPTVEPA